MIKGVYGVSEQTYHLLDMFCNLLEKITTPVPTAATAILKWKTYEALAKHLPPPLAAVGTVAMVSNSTMKRNSSQSMEQLFPSLANSGGGGGIGTGGVFASSDPAAGHSPDSMVKTASGGFGGVDHRYSSPTNPTGDHMMASDVSGMAGMFHTSSAPGTATDTFNNSNTNNSRQMTRQQQSQQQQQILYARTLGALPSSFFYVISNLCQSLQGVSKAFGDGYLRRALEKCVIAYEDLELASVFDEDYIREHEHAVLVAKLGVGAVAEDEETHQHGHSRMTNNGYVFDQEHHEDLEQERIERGKAQLGKYSSANTIDKAREDITAVLRILNRCANYNNSKLGSSNELIFLPQYGVIEMCCSILSSSTCPRNDPVFTTAMTCICTFSKDGYRVVDQFIAGSMPQIILEELSRTKEGDNSNCLEIKHLVECLEIIRNFTITMSTEEAVTSFFPLYREHVMRVVRLYPEKALFGNDVLWNMAKIGMSKHKGLSDGSGSIGSGGMEQLQKEINELARSTVDFDDPACFTPAKGTLKTGSMALVRSSIEYSKEAIASVGLSSPLNSGSSPNKSGDRPGCFSPHRAGSFLGSRSMIVNTTGSNVSAEDIASGAIKGAELVRRAKERKALKKKSSIAVDDEQVTVISYTEEELREGVEKTPGTYLAVGVTTNGGLKATTDHHNI